jgi:hypothetical protein
MKKVAVVVAALAVGAGVAHADTVAYWAFQSTVPPGADNFKMNWPLIADLKANAGPATLDTDARKWDGTINAPTAIQQGALQHFTGSLLNAQAPFTAGADLSMRSLNGDSNGKSYFLAFDNTNFSDTILSFADRYTSTGPTDVAFSYSTDGVNYTAIPAAAYNTTGFRDSTYRTRTIDLSAVDALDGVATASIKITYTGFSATSGTGSVRLDNILVSGSSVPAPGAAMVLGLGGLLAARRRR